MPKFTVDVKEVWCHTVEVELPESATRQQIIDAVNDKIEEDDEGNMEYSHTLDPDQWTIRDEQGKCL
jgi:PhoPQ-activated pathogenicity-related protein